MKILSKIIVESEANRDSNSVILKPVGKPVGKFETNPLTSPLKIETDRETNSEIMNYAKKKLLNTSSVKIMQK